MKITKDYLKKLILEELTQENEEDVSQPQVESIIVTFSDGTKADMSGGSPIVNKNGVKLSDEDVAKYLSAITEKFGMALDEPTIRKIGGWFGMKE